MNRRSFLKALGALVALPALLPPSTALALADELTVAAGGSVLLLSLYAAGRHGALLSWHAPPGHEIVFLRGEKFGVTFTETQMIFRRGDVEVLNFGMRQPQFLTLFAEHNGRQCALTMEPGIEPRIEWLPLAPPVMP